MEKIKYEKRLFYPNMREGETLIWNRFLEKFPDAYDEVIYNLKLGEGADIPPETKENLAKDFKELTQHKIDVVGFKGAKIDIIEVKPYAGLTAVGQVLGYKELYLKHIDPGSSPNLVIVTDVLRPDTKTVIEKQGILVVVV